MTNSGTARGAHASVHVDIPESTPRFHTDHEAMGEISICVADYPVSVYLTGSVIDLIRWAGQVSDAAADWQLAQPQPERTTT